MPGSAVKILAELPAYVLQRLGLGASSASYSTFLLCTLWEEAGIASRPGSLLPIWETWIECPPPFFSLIQLGLLQGFWGSELADGRFLSGSILLPLK